MNFSELGIQEQTFYETLVAHFQRHAHLAHEGKVAANYCGVAATLNRAFNREKSGKFEYQPYFDAMGFTLEKWPHPFGKCSTPFYMLVINGMDFVELCEQHNVKIQPLK